MSCPVSWPPLISHLIGFPHSFDKYGGETGLPPILIASIAMQESSCRAEVTGGGGELGLMQITKEKCTAGIDCKDPDYNIKTGTYYLKSRLDAAGGNVLLALGGYNVCSPHRSFATSSKLMRGTGLVRGPHGSQSNGYQSHMLRWAFLSLWKTKLTEPFSAPSPCVAISSPQTP